MRSSQEIQTEIETLKSLLDKVVPKTAFGESNKDAIEVQITVLEEGLLEGDCYDRFEPGEDDEINDDEMRSERNLDQARYASAWMQEDEDEAPSLGWQPLCK